jgi:hypothetical protein
MGKIFLSTTQTKLSFKYIAHTNMYLYYTTYSLNNKIIYLLIKFEEQFFLNHILENI